MITVAHVSDVAYGPLAGFILAVAQVSGVAHGPFVPILFMILHLFYIITE